MEETTKKSILDNIILKLNMPGLDNKTNLFRLLALTQKAGLWMRDALISIKKSETNKWLIMILEEILKKINEGTNLSTAMRSLWYFFTEDEIALVESSEIMGNLPDVLNQIATELENSQKIRQKIQKAISYPSILIVFSIIAIVILMIYVIPSIVTMFPSKESLPQITKIVLKLSDFLRSNWYRLFLLIASLTITYKILYKYFLPFKALMDWIIISVPVLKDVTKSYYMYKFSNTLWQLYQAWVNPVLSLKLISNVFSNFHYKKKVIEIKRDLKWWFTFAESMEWSKLFDPILIQIIHIWEETWTISSILSKISWFYRDQLETKIDVLMSFLEPLILSFIAIVIWWIVASIFLPMAEILNTIK